MFPRPIRNSLQHISGGLVTIVLGATLALSSPTTNPTTTPAEAKPHAFDDIVAAAHEQLLEKYPYPGHPGTHPANFTNPPQVTRYDDHWEVTWTLPPRTTGGAPVVRLERENLKFISVQFHQ